MKSDKIRKPYFLDGQTLWIFAWSEAERKSDKIRKPYFLDGQA